MSLRELVAVLALALGAFGASVGLAHLLIRLWP